MIYVGADHGGFSMKTQLKQWLDEWHMPYEDVGAAVLDAEDDYPDFALAVAQKVSVDPHTHKGILACRSAAGMVIAANKVARVRAVAPMSIEAAQHSRAHNDANVIGLSGNWLTPEQAKAIVQQWLITPFSAEPRHQHRLDKITAFENQQS